MAVEWSSGDGWAAFTRKPNPNATPATRGNLAEAIWGALGIGEATSTGKFGDAGPLDGITSSLMDLGITKGVGDGQFGTTQNTTRGQAFTMIARALGLADSNTSIEAASQALVSAGIVQGYGGDPNNLGLNDPLQVDHLQMLIQRVAPVLKAKDAEGSSIGERLVIKADDLRNQGMAKADPAYAAFLAANGIALDRVDDEIKLREELFNEDARRRTETYGRAAEAGVEGIQMDFENRGLFRSGTRLQREADKRKDIGFQQEAEQYAAQRAREAADRASGQRKADLEAEAADARMKSGTGTAVTQIDDSI